MESQTNKDKHGESMYNLDGKIGGDADISPRGEKYAKILPQLAREAGVPKDITIWTSTLKRTSQTARYLVEEFGCKKLEWKALDELESGVCDGMTVSMRSNEIIETLTGCSTQRSKESSRKISKPATKTNTIIDTGAESHIVMLSFD